MVSTFLWCKYYSVSSYQPDTSAPSLGGIHAVGCQEIIKFSVILWTGVQGCAGTAGVREWHRRIVMRMSGGRWGNASLYRHVKA